MAWMTSMVACLALAGVAVAADLMTCERALLMGGEETANGTSAVSVVPAPDAPADTHTLRLCFRLGSHGAGDWVDVATQLSPPVSFALDGSARLWIRAEQNTDFLNLKLVDPDNPGANCAAFEGPLLHEGKALPAGQWVALNVPLPAEPVRRDGLTYLGFYINAADPRVPIGEDIIVYIGQFPYELPPRPPWPPVPRGPDLKGATLVPGLSELQEGGCWALVGGRDNQTDHLAQFRDGGVEFQADAAGWNEFLWSVPERLVLAPKTRYKLQFDYIITGAPGGGEGATFYALARAQGTIREDVAWQRWGGTAGTQGRRSLLFTTHDVSGYYIIFGVRHQGGIRIEKVRVLETAAAASDGGGE